MSYEQIQEALDDEIYGFCQDRPATCFIDDGIPSCAASRSGEELVDPGAIQAL
jgi:hypothetical protein